MYQNTFVYLNIFIMQGVHITLRMRLQCQIIRMGQEFAAAGDIYEVLNEVVVDRGSNSFLTKIECWESGRLITKVPTREHICPSIAHTDPRDDINMLNWLLIDFVQDL